MKKILYILLTSGLPLIAYSQASLDTISNGESGLSVRTKLNNTINYVKDSVVTDTISVLATKYDVATSTPDTINEIATKYDLTQVNVDSSWVEATADTLIVNEKAEFNGSIIINPLTDLTPSTISFANSVFQKSTITENTEIVITNLQIGTNTLWITDDGGAWIVTKGTGWGTAANNTGDINTTASGETLIQLLYDGSRIRYFISTIN